MRSPSASSELSTTIEVASAYLYDLVGKAISVNGEVYTILDQSGTRLTCTPLSPGRTRSARMTPHSESGHSFWPDRSRLPNVYRCARCGTEKRPGFGSDATCDAAMTANVEWVHDL